MRHYFNGVLQDSLNDSSNDGPEVDSIDAKIVAFDDQETLEICSTDVDTREGIEKLGALIDKLQASKTQLYKETVEENAKVVVVLLHCDSCRADKNRHRHIWNADVSFTWFQSGQSGKL